MQGDPEIALPSEDEYVLGTHEQEVERLFDQHRVWRPFVFNAWQRAGFRRGQVLLDIGCGPGAATLDLAELVGPSGQVIAVDRSRLFLDVLQRQALARGVANIHAHCADVLDWRAEAPVEGAWCRWLFSFVSDPARLAQSLAQWCRPHARLVVHEYYDYGAWRMHPSVPELDEFVSAVMQSWRDTGGEPDIALTLPRLFVDSGFRLLEQRPLAQVLTTRDHAWLWPSGFLKTGVERLVQLKYLSPARARKIHDAYVEAERTPGVQMVAPAVMEIIAERLPPASAGNIA